MCTHLQRSNVLRLNQSKMADTYQLVTQLEAKRPYFAKGIMSRIATIPFDASLAANMEIPTGFPNLASAKVLIICRYLMYVHF